MIVQELVRKLRKAGYSVEVDFDQDKLYVDGKELTDTEIQSLLRQLANGG